MKSLGRRARGLFAAKEVVLQLPAHSKGAKDVRSADLGDRSGWIGRNFVSELADDIQTAVLTDSLLLRAMHDYERLARQGGITMEPAYGEGINERKAYRAMLEVQNFLGGILTPFGESWEDLFYVSAFSLAVFHNYAMERIWQGSQIVNLDLLPWGSVVQIVDKRGIPLGWIQFDYSYRRIPFALQEIAHGHMNRWPGDRYGTPELAPASGANGDLQAFRLNEARWGQQADQTTFPYAIINFGTKEQPVTDPSEQTANEATVKNMARYGCIVGNGKVSGQVLSPVGMDQAPLNKHWKERLVVSTGRSLLSLGMPEQINVATAEVIDAKEAQNQLATVLSGAANWRRTLFAWVLYTRGIDPQLAPHLIPGEPNPVRRERNGKHAMSLGDGRYVTRDEVRRENGYPATTKGQAAELDRAIAPKQPQQKDETPKQEERQEQRAK